MEYAIRKATIKDAQLLADIGMKTFYEAYCDTTSVKDMNTFLSTRFSIEEIKIHLIDPEIENFLAFDADYPAGYFVLSSKRIPDEMKGENAIELARIYAGKEYWRKKLGSLMMQQAITIASEKKFEVLWLQVWDENFRAIEFYKHFGFETQNFRVPFQVGNRIDYDLVMKMEIFQKIK